MSPPEEVELSQVNSNSVAHGVPNNELLFFVNGRKVVDSRVRPSCSLAEYLRINLKLTGTKISCSEGGCGACTVMVSDSEGQTSKIRYYTVNACLFPVLSCHGKAITTIEGIGNHASPHAVQKRLHMLHGTQCGFCTPGFAIAMYALLRNNPTPTKEDVHRAISGNLCRCTGYRPILEAFYSFTKDSNKTTGCKENTGEIKQNVCCGGKTKEGGCCKTVVNGSNKTSSSHIDSIVPYDATQEPIFPPELKLLLTSKAASPLHMIYDHNIWFTAATVHEALKFKQAYPQAKFVFGNTEIGIEQTQLNQHYTVVINTRELTELRFLKMNETHITIGAGYSLNELDQLLRQIIGNNPRKGYRYQVLTAVCQMLRWFAGAHVRNMASMAGNLITASPISDLNQIWLAAKCSVELRSLTDRRVESVDDKFFLGYRRTLVASDEMITAIHIPLLKEDDHFQAYKQALRKDDDRAIVNAAFHMKMNSDLKIQKLRAAFGGMAPITRIANESCEKIIGCDLSTQTITTFLDSLSAELHLPYDVVGGLADYRTSMCRTFAFKFLMNLLAKSQNVTLDTDFDDLEYVTDEVTSTQIFTESEHDLYDGHDYVHRPISHQSGDVHTTGEAKYTDDIDYESSLHLELVLSAHAHARLLNIDYSKAAALPGVQKVLTSRDVPNSRNRFPSSPAHPNDIDNVVFADGTVTYYSQPIAAVVADSAYIARQAAQLVKVEYEVLTPLVTIDDAITNQSFHNPTPLFVTNSLEPWDKVDKDFETSGTTRVGGQEHFYFEPVCCIAEPGERGAMTVSCSTQSCTYIQQVVSGLLNVPCHKIVVKVKRIGGGFGGKETASTVLVLPCVVAAHVMQRPIRACLSRQQDMAITGTRHPFYIKWKIAKNANNKISGYEATYYSNAGFSWDLSQEVMMHSMINGSDGGYTIGHMALTGYCCKTNIASNTAFRGFGTPQAFIAIESAIDTLCEQLNLCKFEFRANNLCKEGDMKFCNRKLVNCNLRRCWTEVVELSKYHQLRADVKQFNNTHQHAKRGLSIQTVKYGIGFGLKCLNQAGCLIHVYLDGSVLVSHAGMEMGQGLHTKVIQVAAHVLDVDISQVHVDNTATDKVPNTSPTAASISSDLNCQAVQNACEEIQRRLKPYRKPNVTWIEAVQAAYDDCVSLSTTGFHQLSLSSFSELLDGKPHETDVFKYCVYGSVVSMVQIDVLTGSHKVVSTHIVMDIGQSLNPAIDVGQIEGAFMQGYGLTCLEQQRYHPDGRLITRGPGTYKIPSAVDCPRVFNVKLLGGSSNPTTVFSSKAVGEPPLLLGTSVLFAIRDAIWHARQDLGVTGAIRLNSPATPDRIHRACRGLDDQEYASDGKRPWAVELS